ncbi:hypothetical protein [Chlamydia sp.]|uniref:hypothetical protein n=1 Tax=Chlamydia sp. TaxID=35827 RepID=UPI0025C3A111|nr:hypothetical protein [Chlamydia sp.]MBQ8498743.1 hypothetical protein [Chlamydia sp.]
MTIPTPIVASSSSPSDSFPKENVHKSSPVKLPLVEAIQRIVAFAALIIVGVIGLLALLGHVIGFLIFPQVSIVLLVMFIIALAGCAFYLYKTAPLHLYKELQKEVASLKEINLMLSNLQKEFLSLSKEFATTSEDLSVISFDFCSSLQNLQDTCGNFESLFNDYKDSVEELRKIFSGEMVRNLTTSVANLKKEVEALSPLAEEVRHLAENKQTLTETIEDLKIVRNNLTKEIKQLSDLSSTLGEQIKQQREENEKQKEENEKLCLSIKDALSQSHRAVASPEDPDA